MTTLFDPHQTFLGGVYENSMRLKKFWTQCTRVTFCTWQGIMHFINIFFPLLPLLVGVKLILKFSWVIYLTPTQEAKKEREQKRNTMPIFEGHQQINWVRFYFFEAKYHGMKSFQDQNFLAQTFSWDSLDHDLMASIWEKAISILAGNLNSSRSYLITAVCEFL